MIFILTLQVIFIVAFFAFSRYDPELSATLPSGSTPALDHYYPRK
jgi:hypothetical protein